MDLYKSLEDLERVLDKEIQTVAQKGSITPTELENMTKTLCLVEKIKEYKMGVPENGDEYSNRYMNSYNNPSNRSYGNNRNSYYDGMHNNGRYYNDDMRYSRHSIQDRMIAKLESMYDSAETDHEKQIVNDWIRRLRVE